MNLVDPFPKEDQRQIQELKKKGGEGGGGGSSGSFLKKGGVQPLNRGSLYQNVLKKGACSPPGSAPVHISECSFY